MQKRQGKYPNQADFNPFIQRSLMDEENLYELPLSDPSETLPADSYQARIISQVDLSKPSAFSVNKKMNVKSN
ncbi:hypothetical protein [Sporosarcina ureilytica]|uniref:Uncharacterized protein n=1 Tax=Sporosarcina ureilytica TaxID=298596 RepID=A0A1D8JFY0_9BACL|nr:hypothetical protein [Sporosarcina ureilytica]AOV07621.1 hypothetical protein BI350_08795 [Sporosarcina ureilytica]